MKLKDKRAVITGSSRSIGREIAKCLAEESAKVVINASGASDASRAAMDSVVEEIRDLGGTAIGIAGAVDDPASAKALVEGCVSEFGGIDILINNAGTYDTDGVSGVADCSDESWKKLFSVNVDAVFYTCRAALPHMVKQQWGRIINLAPENLAAVPMSRQSQPCLVWVARSLPITALTALQSTPTIQKLTQVKIALSFLKSSSTG